nr:progesterone receptor-like isoform X3 [Anser cygnoides]
MGRMWGAAAPTRLLLLLLVLAGLCARDAWAMPRRALAAGDDARGSAYPAPQLDPGVELQGHPSGRAVPAAPWNPAPETGWHPTGDGYVTSEHGPVPVPQGDPTSVAVGDGYPASPLGPGAELQGGHTGPRRAMRQAKRGKSSQRTSEILKEILKELEGAQGADGEAVKQEAFPRGNTLPGSEGATEAAQATVPPVLSEPGEARHTGVFQFFRENPGTEQAVSGSRVLGAGSMAAVPSAESKAASSLRGWQRESRHLGTARAPAGCPAAQARAKAPSCSSRCGWREDRECLGRCRRAQALPREHGGNLGLPALRHASVLRGHPAAQEKTAAPLRSLGSPGTETGPAPAAATRARTSTAHPPAPGQLAAARPAQHPPAPAAAMDTTPPSPTTVPALLRGLGAAPPACGAAGG